MAAGDYLKQAASSMHRAATQLQQQAKEMQNNMVRMRSDQSTVIDKHTSEIKAKQAQAANTNDNTHRSRLSVEIQKLQDEIVAAEQAIKKAEADVTQAVQAKLGTSQDIENQARQLETQAGTID